MMRFMCKSKIHRAIVTEANLEYEGSITIDRTLIREADLYPFEKVQIANLNNGKRLETYVIEGEDGSGQVCLNGAAARHAEEGDPILIISYCMIEDAAAKQYSPRVVHVDQKNRITKVRFGLPETAPAVRLNKHGADRSEMRLLKTRRQ